MAWPLFELLAQTLRRQQAEEPLSGEAIPSFEVFTNEESATLALPPQVFRDILTTGSLEPHFHYRRFYRAKRDGRWREIAEPDAKLKKLQHAIIRRYLTTEQPHPAALAYQAGRSTADHVWRHAGAAVIILADIQDFFPNTHAVRVEQWWRQRVDDDTARVLTVLTTDRDGLPQGAPTSPGLSNLVNRDLDTRLANLAALAGARYSRYCDDLAFSWSVGAAPPAGFDVRVRAILSEFGYPLHPHKGWRVYSREEEPEITGAILTRHGGVRLPARLRDIMRKLARSRDPHDRDRLAGYTGYAKMMTRPPHARGISPPPTSPANPSPPGDDAIPF
ncbi:MAG: reverse transcriptase family protein [Gemmataceae bacterium]|nr:reverse transcriptase family protein [Gemmata sp.]MDW8198217.1 reverse transcriptase family protein [Gemmataceae bacterium]